MATGRKYLGNASRGQAFHSHPESGTQTRAASTYNHDVVGMMFDFVFGHCVISLS
jgi:hypothetical protein